MILILEVFFYSLTALLVPLFYQIRNFGPPIFLSQFGSLNFIKSTILIPISRNFGPLILSNPQF